LTKFEGGWTFSKVESTPPEAFAGADLESNLPERASSEATGVKLVVAIKG